VAQLNQDTPINHADAIVSVWSGATSLFSQASDVRRAD
jgi:hypothetical protein